MAGSTEFELPKACRFERSEKSAVGQESGFLTAKAVRNDKGDGGRLVEW
jgi:hypothetical protein